MAQKNEMTTEELLLRIADLLDFEGNQHGELSLEELDLVQAAVSLPDYHTFLKKMKSRIQKEKEKQ